MRNGKVVRILLFIGLLFMLVWIGTSVVAKEVPFTLEDRDRLIRIETKLEQQDKRLEFIQNLMIGMLAVFGSLCGIFVGLLLWDRKTFKEKAKEEAIKAVEEGKLKAILDALREIAKVDTQVANALRKFNLL